MRAYDLIRLYGPMLAASVALGACTDDLDAPYNYVSDTGSDESGGGLLEIDCGEVPQAAVGATFAHTVTATGGDGNFTFAGTLPPGLMIDSDGNVTGVPTMPGATTLAVTVGDGTGATGMASCPVSIADQFRVDLALDTVPYCLSGATGDTLLQAIADGTGDGSGIGCDAPGGTGNGSVPAGITINPDNCEVEGTVTENRYGTWAFMVRGDQSGAQVFIPYCVSNDEQGTFPITADHSGRTDNALEPVMVTFDPAQPAFAGAAGNPVIRATDPDVCGDGSCNFFGFSFHINSSAFDLAPDIYDDDDDDDMAESKPTVVDAQLLADMNGDSIGMSHGLRLSTNGPVDAPLDARTWIVNLELDYCLGNSSMDCPDTAITANADGFYVFSVIMVPEP